MPSAPQVSPDFDSLLATSDFDRIEVLRGPQGFIYGADAGGVVNIVTKRGAGALGGRVASRTATRDSQDRRRRSRAAATAATITCPPRIFGPTASTRRSDDTVLARRRRREEHDRAREARLERDRGASASARRAPHRRVDDVRRLFHDDDVRSRE